MENVSPPNTKKKRERETADELKFSHTHGATRSLREREIYKYK